MVLECSPRTTQGLLASSDNADGGDRSCFSVGRGRRGDCVAMHKICLRARKGRLVSSVVNCFFCFAYECGSGCFELPYLDCLRENVLSCGLRHKILDEYRLLALYLPLMNVTHEVSKKDSM